MGPFSEVAKEVSNLAECLRETTQTLYELSVAIDEAREIVRQFCEADEVIIENRL